MGTVVFAPHRKPMPGLYRLITRPSRVGFNARLDRDENDHLSDRRGQKDKACFRKTDLPLHRRGSVP
ncbi:hypothetical protein SAMN05444172_4734 [Burkholderia sp. GAS332]|nr:hypothetical protein SAMN05444172_4734 [Burkholderia sp. GAS332]